MTFALFIGQDVKIIAKVPGWWWLYQSPLTVTNGLSPVQTFQTNTCLATRKKATHNLIRYLTMDVNVVRNADVM